MQLMIITNSSPPLSRFRYIAIAKVDDDDDDDDDD
jgi:hypothetical protein